MTESAALNNSNNEKTKDADDTFVAEVREHILISVKDGDKKHTILSTRGQ